MQALVRYRASVAALVAAWVVCFGLSLDDALDDTAFSPLVVVPADGPDGYPSIASFRVGLEPAETDLEPGDRLLALGEVDLRGASTPRWVSALAGFHGSDPAVSLKIERAGQKRTIGMQPASFSLWWPRLAASVVFGGCALFLLARLRQSEIVRALVLSNLAVAWFMAGWFAGGPLETWTSLFAQGLSIGLALPLTLRAFLLFPHGIAPRRRWVAWGVWGFAALAVFDTSLYWGMPFPQRVGAVGLGAIGVTYAFVFVATLTRGYQISDAIGRRRLRWVVFGAYLSAIPAALGQGISVASPDVAWLVALSVSGVAVFPLCMLVAITRYNFLDIDRVLSSTAALSVLVVVLLVSVVFVLPGAAASLGDQLEIHSATARLLLLLALMLPLVPAHRSLRRWIERVFVADRYRLESGIAMLVEQLSACASPEDLPARTVDGIDGLLQPRCCALYLRGTESTFPAYSRGVIDPPRLEKGDPVVGVLAEQRGPLTLDDASASRPSARQRAVLQTLGAQAVVPVRLDGSLVAFLCLCDKRSGDVYTRGDLVLVALVCDKLADQLRRFQQRKQLDAVEALNERMRPYLGETLAAHLERGESLDVGERVVSVLFVDMRDYSSYVEKLGADQVLSTVSRYADAVSSIVEEHGGTVINFAGDGIMAVFGAPDPLEQMERSAVAAGRAIVERLPRIAGGEALAVGVGVATGPASVRNVHAAGRLHWTALGHTTNLASRLQALTRDLGAAMIVDEATWRRAGQHAQGFQRRDEVPIRGLERCETLYVMTLGA